MPRGLFHVKPKRMFCWHCGGDLQELQGKLLFVELELPGGNKVKVHKICVKSAKNHMHFDTTPDKGELEPTLKGHIGTRHCHVCGTTLPDHWSFSVCPAHLQET